MAHDDDAVVPLDALTRKLARLAQLAPGEVKGVEILVDDALERHAEDARRRPLAKPPAPK